MVLCPSCLLTQPIRTSIEQEDTTTVRFRTPKVLLAFVAVAILVGCTSSNNATLPDADFFVAQGSPFLIRFGESVGVQTPSSFVIIQMSDILGDSRCPATVECVDAGSVIIRLAVQTALSVQEVDVEVPPSGETTVVVEEVTIQIIGVAPAAQEGVAIDLLEYETAMQVVQTGDLGVPQ